MDCIVLWIYLWRTAHVAHRAHRRFLQEFLGKSVDGFHHSFGMIVDVFHRAIEAIIIEGLHDSNMLSCRIHEPH